MATGVERRVSMFGADVQRRTGGWFAALGISQIFLGMIALGACVFMPLVTVVLFGWLLLLSGVLSVVPAFWQKYWIGSFSYVAMGILYSVVGFTVVGNPLAPVESLAMLIGGFLLTGGAFRVMAAIVIWKHQYWVWVGLNGVIAQALGVMIWQQWPLSGLWAIGLFIGIDLIFYGWSLLMVGLSIKRLLRNPSMHYG